MGDGCIQNKVLLVTPPFTQLNTPYPATAYLKGYLNTLGVDAVQRDFSLETILLLFTKGKLSTIFSELLDAPLNHDINTSFVFAHRVRYMDCIEPVVHFLQGGNDALAYRIISRKFLPEGDRFSQVQDLEWAFGELGIMDKAKYLATLFLEDLGDFIKEFVDEDFGFSRYAERMARTASGFEDLHHQLQHKNSVICEILQTLVKDCLAGYQPKMVCITAPFPGNIFGAFFIAKTIKEINESIICVLGGGYVNTELRSVYEARVFDYFDYITIDDGELPIRQLVYRHICDQANVPLKRTFVREHGQVIYANHCSEFDIPQREVGTPDYRGLWWNKYISVIEVLNPMHKLWSDGQWNKLTLAHGCYWGKCTFCDVTLDYISRYEPLSASLLCDRIEEIILQNGIHGFHFVDEAAPPALLKDLALEIIQRRLVIQWWTNIRFEKAFTHDLCKLLAVSGCIAVTGGLEVASDRLLHFMKKGVTIEQVTNVTNHFTKHGILVHAYLMYGFPTQSEQETIDSLEVVRQLMVEGFIQSGFWHQFAMTAHSPVGQNPQLYNVIKTGPEFKGFAENDCYHEDPSGADHEKFSTGLQHAMFNFMQGLGYEEPIHSWFDFSTPKTTIVKNYIKSLVSTLLEPIRAHQQILWLGTNLEIIHNEDNYENTSLYFITGNERKQVDGKSDVIAFLFDQLVLSSPGQKDFQPLTVEKFSLEFNKSVQSSTWDEFLHSYLFYQLREKSLLIV